MKDCRHISIPSCWSPPPPPRPRKGRGPRRPPPHETPSTSVDRDGGTSDVTISHRVCRLTYVFGSCASQLNETTRARVVEGASCRIVRATTTAWRMRSRCLVSGAHACPYSATAVAPRAADSGQCTLAPNSNVQEPIVRIMRAELEVCAALRIERLPSRLASKCGWKMT